MRLTIGCLVLVFFVGQSTAIHAEVSLNESAVAYDPTRFERVSAAISQEVASRKIPGAVALVVRDGDVVYFKSFGYSNVRSKAAMRDDSIFRIASMTKAITTTAIMTLYEDGHFELSDPIGKYLPAFSKMSVVSKVDDDGYVTATVAATKSIRIIDLLTHTSGIGYPFIKSSVQKSYVEAGIVDGVTGKDITLESQMALLAEQPLMFEPGTQYTYGLSTDVLGYLVEVISGRSLAQYFADEIFAPLGMGDTFFYLPQDKADRLVTLYTHVDDKGLIELRQNESALEIEDPMYPVRGARSYFSGGAGLSSTAYDYGRFLQMLLNGGELDGTRVLSRDSVDLMRTARIDWDGDDLPDASLGFRVTSDLGKKGESGSAGTYSWGGAFYTSFWVDPKQDMIGVFMSQARPVDSTIAKDFSALVYEALE